MTDQVVQCAACHVDARRVKDTDLVRCPVCGLIAPKSEAVQAARSAVIARVMRDLPEHLRLIVRADAALGYRPADRYEWILN